MDEGDGVTGVKLGETSRQRGSPRKKPELLGNKIRPSFLRILLRSCLILGETRKFRAKTEKRNIQIGSGIKL